MGRKSDEPHVSGLNRQLVDRWWAKFQSTFEQHNLDGKTSRETVVTPERFEEMAKLFINLVGGKGQQNFKECVCARRCFDDSVSQISGVLAAWSSKEDCLRTWRRLLEVSPLSSPTEDISERLGAPASGEACSQALQNVCKSQMVQSETYRCECKFTMDLFEQCDRFTEKLQDRFRPSPESEGLKQYSEDRGRYIGQGRGYQSLFIDYLVDNSDPNSASTTPEMKEKRKRKIRDARSDGRWFSTMCRQFGPGIFCYIRVQTKTS
jgi:hypothetical protein